MKCVVYLLALTLCVLFFEQTLAQCSNEPRNPICRGPEDIGTGGRGCRPGIRWAYDWRSRTCFRFRYLGCEGNRNRWCSLRECQDNCERRQ